MTLAEIVAGEWTKEAIVPSYVDELVKMVERSRLMSNESRSGFIGVDAGPCCCLRAAVS